MCVDEHIPGPITEVFRRFFRTVEASQWNRVRGRDEREYFRDLFATNTVFVTSDLEFAQSVADNYRRHAGLIYVPNKNMTPDQQTTYVEVCCYYVRGGCDGNSPRAFNNCLLHPKHDGLHLVRRGEDELAIPWGALWDPTDGLP